MSSGGTAHSSVSRLYTRRHRYAWNRVSSMPRFGRWTMRSERIQGHEWGTYVVRACSSGAEHGRAYKTRVSWSRSSRSTQLDGCNGLTQTDRNVCRWLADHRTGDPVRGRAGEGEQVARGPATGRRASCAEATADLVIIQAGLGGGHWRAA